MLQLSTACGVHFNCSEIILNQHSVLILGDEMGWGNAYFWQINLSQTNFPCLCSLSLLLSYILGGMGGSEALRVFKVWTNPRFFSTRTVSFCLIHLSQWRQHGPLWTLTLINTSFLKKIINFHLRILFVCINSDFWIIPACFSLPHLHHLISFLLFSLLPLDFPHTNSECMHFPLTHQGI